jgi:Ca2+-binding EF-hand superfamily protein
MSQEPLRTRFESVDTDGNGRIDQSEFGRLLDALGMGFSDPQIRAAFVDIDRDADGHIDLAEFSSWWTAR